MNAFLKWLLIICGSLSLALGVLGLLLPVLPGTPFLLLAAVCYAKSSERLYLWLLRNRWVGKYIQDYRSGQGIPLGIKILAITLLWLSIGFSVLVVIPLLIIKILVLLIALYITWIIMRIKTRKSKYHWKRPNWLTNLRKRTREKLP